jgi:hypothetical protein
VLLPAIVALCFFASGTVASGASAAPVSADHAVSVQQTLDSLKTANPGSAQVSASTIRLSNGVEVTALPASPRAGTCTYLYLCLWDSVGFYGNELKFFNCGFVNIGTEFGWSDRIKSFINDQSRGTVSIFMNWTGSYWQELHRSVAWSSSPLPGKTAPTDGIWVC